MVSTPSGHGIGVCRLLTDAKIKAAKGRQDGPYKLADSAQLYLYVTPAGGKHWRMNYAFGPSKKDPKKLAQKTLTFGPYPHVTLVEARAMRDAAKKLLLEGKDPAIEKRVADDDRATAAANTFRVIGEKWFERNSGWSLEKLRAYAKDHGGKWSHRTARHWTVRRGQWSPIHSADTLKSLEGDLLAEIGNLPIASIKAPRLLEILQKVEARGAIETAHRVRQRASAIFVYGIAAGVCEADPAASLGKALTPKPVERKQPSIVDGIDDQAERLKRIRKLLADCEAERCRAITKFAMLFIALTAVRPGEQRFAEWSEFEGIDWTKPDAPAPNALWRIPASRMKGDEDRKAEAGGDHLVPLAPPTVRLLHLLHRLSGDLPYVFPGERHLHRPMSENTLRALLIRAKYYQRHVPHGFRATFSTYMNDRPLGERKDGDRAIIDLMLAHMPAGASGSEGAYNRAAYMARRRELACEWADLITAELADPETYLGQPIRYAATGPGRPDND